MGDSLKKISKHARQYKHVLLLMRHAKAESGGQGADIDRELTDKGLKQAKHVAKGLAGMKLVPESIVCSGAVRTRQTLARMVKVFGDGPRVDYRQSLYDQGKNAVFDELAHVPETVGTLLIVGHEPTVSMTSGLIATKDSDAGLLALLSVGVSNASVVILGSDEPFDKWDRHSADLVAVLTPKDFS
ncbi:MAG: histidine phosphatase family protein [Bifidobacteriaceae bacterium]|jgi:phosphohistidine phosphatase|nr:histidine phosphatase family protein [Bifidobacteriaceae bacterium]MCI1914159.1 histidine phosphatase family protein [Bifidobacteriaceae bacterium]